VIVAKPKSSTGGQVARFASVGVLNTAIDYVIYISLTKIFSIPLERVWTAKLVSGTVAMFNSFYFNRNWVFKRNGSKHATQQFMRFVVSTLVAVYVIQLGLVQFFTTGFPYFGELAYKILEGIGLTAALPNLLTEPFVIKTVAFALATVASMTWNFFLYKLWAFKE
jgi:putative flippase GtrA